MKPNKSKIELFKPGVEKLPAKKPIDKFLETHTIEKTSAQPKQTVNHWGISFFTRLWQWVKKVPDKLSKGYDFIVSLPQTIANVKSIGWVLAVVVIGAIIIIVLLKI